MQNGEYVTITIRSLPAHQFGQPAIIRLRRLLKAMLRSFGFRCVRIEPAALREEVVVDDHHHCDAA